MIYKVTIMTFLILTIISSIFIGKAYDTGMMVIAAVVFYGSLFLKRMNIYTFSLQLALLAVFHWFTQLNWCHGIYLIMVASYSANQSKLVKSLGFGIIVTALYTFRPSHIFAINNVFLPDHWQRYIKRSHHRPIVLLHL